MQELLTNPAIQAAGAPFVVALALALIMRRFYPGGTGLAIIAGFGVAVWLITGLTLQPLTSTRKIILCGLALPFLLPLLEMIPQVSRAIWVKHATQIVPAVLLVAASALWIIWPVLRRQEGMAMWAMALPLVLYIAAVIGGTGLLGRRDSSSTFSAQAASALVLALGTGATTLIAASALYSQLAFAISAATGAVIVVGMFGSSTQPTRLGMLVAYAAAVPVVLIGAGATVYAKLPLLVLLCLALVPLFAGLPLIKPQQRWLQLIVTCLWASVPVIPAVWLAWRAAGPVSF